MKFGQIRTILTILLLIGCFVQPVASAVTVSANTTEKDNATSYYNSGDLLVVQGDYKNAITLFDLALASNTSMIKKSDGLLYLYRDKAYAQIQLASYDDALTTIETGLAQYPKDKMLWNNKGYALFRLGRFQDALTSYDTALSYDGNYTTALINKGDTLSKLGRYPEAVTAYQQANVTDPGNQVATAGIATAQAAAQTAAESSARTTTIILVIVLIAAIGGVIWYLKFRKPREPAPSEPAPAGKKPKGKKK
jgi:tetratricopeptide (TPR) repeat protein